MGRRLYQVKCPNCGGPLQGLTAATVTCDFCLAEFENRWADRAREHAQPGLPPYEFRPSVGMVRLGNAPFRICGRVGRGRSADLFLAQRHHPFTEQVLLKVSRDPTDERVASEFRGLGELSQLGRGSYLEQVVPEPVAQGLLLSAAEPQRTPLPAAAYRWRSGFHHNLEQVRDRYPDGIEGQAAIWIWGRLLEQLGTLHQAGYHHRAVTLDHVLIHPRDHGVRLCGWTAAGPAAASRDIIDSADCLAVLTGPNAPSQLRQLFDEAGRYRCALELARDLKKAAEQAYGPPRFRPFSMERRSGSSHPAGRTN